MNYSRICCTALLAVLFGAGCYNPKFQNGVACGPAGECPPGTACLTDNKCHRPGDVLDAGPGDAVGDAASDAAIDAHRGLDIDAAPTIDAAPVGCSGDADCQMPPDLCSTAGTCDLSQHACTFPHVDCSAMNDPCNLGVCTPATGQCAKAPANSGFTCGNTVCGAFGTCGSFDSTCDSSGTQSQSCTENKCSAGVCQPNTYTVTQGCSRTTDGVTCGDTTTTNCNACDYTGQCDEAAQQSCTCTSMTCAADVCTPSAAPCTLACTRNTEGDSCGTCSSFRTKECQGGLCVTTDC